MSDIPWTTLTVVVLLNLIVLVSASVVCGIAVARSADASTARGVLIGLLLPVIGPAVWSVVVLVDDPGRLRMKRGEGAPRVLLVALLAPALLAYAISWLLPWGSAEVTARGMSTQVDSSASGNPVSTAVVLATIAIVGLLLYGALSFVNRGRLVVVLASIGSLWLLVMVDVWMLSGAANGVAAMVSLIPDAEAEASVAAGPAVYAGMVGAVLTLAAAVALLPGVGRPPLAAPPMPSAAPNGAAAVTTRVDRGDGF